MVCNLKNDYYFCYPRNYKYAVIIYFYNCFTFDWEVYVCECRSPWRLEALDSPGAGLMGGDELSDMDARTEFSSSARPAFAFNLSPTSPAPVNII